MIIFHSDFYNYLHLCYLNNFLIRLFAEWDTKAGIVAGAHDATPRHQQDHRILAVEVENHVAAAVVAVVVVAMAMVHPDISGEMPEIILLT